MQLLGALEPSFVFSQVPVFSAFSSSCGGSTPALDKHSRSVSWSRELREQSWEQRVFSFFQYHLKLSLFGSFHLKFLVLGAFQVFITPIYTAGTWQEDRSMCFSPSWKPLAWWCQFRAHDPGGGSTSVLTTSFCSRKIQLFYFN